MLEVLKTPLSWIPTKEGFWVSGQMVGERVGCYVCQKTVIATFRRSNYIINKKVMYDYVNTTEKPISAR